jgi:glutaconyl-CoA/methylmalonyl-CoA decarboxylase subunit gamma
MKIQVRIDNQTYSIEIDDIYARPVIATVEDDRFEVWPETADSTGSAPPAAPLSSVLEPASVSSALDRPADSAASGDVVSPLPGVIVAVLVKPGESVTRGQELCTLEAMKMKNAIRSNRDGTIAAIEVSVGDQVNHGQVLITYAK